MRVSNHLPALLAAIAAALLTVACEKRDKQIPKTEAEKQREARDDSKKTPEPLQVGFVYAGPVGDAGWTHQHHLAKSEMEQKLQGKVVATYMEKVPEGADAERVIRDLAQQGNKLIFTTSFGFMNPTLKVAEEFPNVMFEHATGYKTAKNVASYNIRFYQGRYLGGIVAGKSTKTHTLGYVAAFPIPEVLQGINGFTRGARSVNPKVQVRVIWVDAWYDPGKERAAAHALIRQGADVVTHHTDSTAVVAAAEEAGKQVVAYHSDMSKFGPKAQLAAVTHHWGAYYTRRAQQGFDSTWTSGSVWMGMADGAIKLEAIHPSVPKDVVDLVNAKEKEIIAGKLDPFAGPIKSNQGKEIVGKGQALTDEQLNQMNFYVEGVVGKVPASK